MTVNSEIKQLTAVSFEEEISSSRLKDLFKAANAAYELVFNTTAPLAASQTYAGHDHTPNGGGGGIFRGGFWSCLGREGLSTFHVGEASFTSSSQKLPLLGTFGEDETFCYFYPSPGLTPESFYEAYLLLEAYYDYEYVLERSGNEILLITGGGF